MLLARGDAPNPRRIGSKLQRTAPREFTRQKLHQEQQVAEADAACAFVREREMLLVRQLKTTDARQRNQQVSEDDASSASLILGELMAVARPLRFPASSM